MDLGMAIDFSTQEASFALGDINSEKIICSHSKIFSGREASSLLSWITSEINNTEFSIKDIKYWTYGIGPGSFTGLRIAASIIAGLTFHKNNLFVRGISSVLPMFDLMPKEIVNKAILFDGRRNEIFYFKNSEQKMPLIISKEVSDTFFDTYECVYAFAMHKDGITKFFGEELAKKIVFIDTFPIHKLLFNKISKYEEISDTKRFYKQKLIYLRPPV